MQRKLTEAQLEILLAHLIRNENVCSQALIKLKPEHWNGVFEAPAQAMWSITQEYYLTYSKMIPRESLRAELDPRIEYGQEMKDFTEWIGTFLDYAYSLEEEDTDSNVGIKLLQMFLDERVMMPAIQDSSASRDKLDDVISDLVKQHRETRITSVDSVDLFDLSNPMFDASMKPPTQTGCRLFDIMTAGGSRESHMTGVLAPFEGGKTLLGIDLCVKAAKLGYHTYMFQYEQPIVSIAPRIWANATGVPIDSFTGRMSEMKPETRAKLESCGDVREFLHTYDMQEGNKGYGGAAEIVSILRSEVSKGVTPSIVLVDWLGVMGRRFCIGQDMDEPNLPHVLSVQLQELRYIANEFNVELVVLHQLNAAAGKKGPQHMPSMYDAADVKTFAALMDTCIVLSKKDHNGVARIYNDKQRGTHAEVFAELVGATSTFNIKTGQMQIVRQGNNMVWMSVDPRFVGNRA